MGTEPPLECSYAGTPEETVLCNLEAAWRIVCNTPSPEDFDSFGCHTHLPEMLCDGHSHTVVEIDAN